MNYQNIKCVLIIDQSLNTGIIANVASILSITIGEKIKELVGPDITDKAGVIHAGLTQIPIPVLGAAQSEISNIRNEFISNPPEQAFFADFSTLAQMARTYEDYTLNLQSASPDEILYLGIALFGDRKAVNKATKGLSLIS